MVCIRCLGPHRDSLRSPRAEGVSHSPEVSGEEWGRADWVSISKEPGSELGAGQAGVSPFHTPELVEGAGGPS
jgi:hypothetical protein